VATAVTANLDPDHQEVLVATAVTANLESTGSSKSCKLRAIAAAICLVVGSLGFLGFIFTE
jgi:hypothetical protein